MLLSEVPTFAKVRISSLGSVDELGGPPDTPFPRRVATVWTKCQSNGNYPFALVDQRGLIAAPSDHLVWLPDDAVVEIVKPPRFAGRPEDLITLARPVQTPAGAKGAMKTAEGWPRLIWTSDVVSSPVFGWVDPLLAVEVLLCALAVAPDDDPELRPMLLAALKARYAKLAKDPNTYPPEKYPWSNGRMEPDEGLLEYLTP